MTAHATSYYRNKPGATVTPGQITAIKMGQRALNIDDDDYRATLWDRYRAASSRDLNFDQAKDLIEDYIAKGFVLVQPETKAKKRQKQAYAQRPPRSSAKVVSLPTRDEIDKINALAQLFVWRAENGLALFLQKRCRVKDGKVRTSLDAYNAIEGLKKYFSNLMTKEHSQHWWLMTFDSPLIMNFIAEHCPAEYRK